MSELASKSQLRMSFVRWAIVTVPLINVLGLLVARMANTGNENRWYAALAKPWFTPPGIAFPIVWTTLYVMMGLALALILSARGARGRGLAIGLFVAQMALNLLWSPTFFLAHQVSVALVVVIAMLALTIATTIAFARIRQTAAWLLVPYIAWLCVATALNFEIDRLNPEAETMVPGVGGTTIPL